MPADDRRIIDALKELSVSNMLPMHMPGHKRNAGLADYLRLLGAEYDITEIEGFDDLSDARGILSRSMERAAALWGSKRTYYLVNGSTGGILAGVRALSRRGGSAIVVRNCHKSVFNALELCGIDPVFVRPEMDDEYGIHSSVRPGEIEKALDCNPDSSLVVLTSPTYEGVISDIAAICKSAHDRGVPVLVDEAHGAHLGFSDFFSGGAVKAGADIVIQSLHKTLPSLTQTAVAHLNGEIADQREFERELALFQTSSPSYLLTASIDACVRLLADEKERLFVNWERALTRFDEFVAGLKNLKILMHGSRSMEKRADFHRFDRSKILISTLGTDISGLELKKTLRREYGIELEMAHRNYALAMTAPGDTEEALLRLGRALLEIDANLSPAKVERAGTAPAARHKVYTLAEAANSEKVCIPLEDAEGRISAEYLFVYPPGVPLIIPGEEISAELISEIKEMSGSGLGLKSSYKTAPERIFVLK